MLGAAPHRGGNLETVDAGLATLGISYRDDLRTAWLAKDGTWAAAVAGMVDNLDELAEKLQSQSAMAGGGSPADVVLAAFRSWRQSTPTRLRGAFAALVTDGTELWAFRDQVGFKSVFYRIDDQGSFWASEAKQVAAGAGLERHADPHAIEQIFYFGLSEDSAVSGVKRMKAGSIANAKPEGRLAITRYWDPSHLVETSSLKLPEAIERLVELLDQAVARTVRGQDAVLLSGGIDSTTVAAFAAPHHLARSSRPLLGLTLAYPDYPNVDELDYTREVAQYLGMPLHAYQPTKRFLGELDHWVDLLDGPWDTLPASLVVESFQEATSQGARIILSGDLAEYVFTMSGFTLGHLAINGRVGPLLKRLRFLHDHGQPWPRLLWRMAKEIAPPGVLSWNARRNDKMRFQTPDWVDAQSTGRPYERRDLTRPARQRWPHNQTYPAFATSSTWEANEICSVLCGVEERRPMVDVDLWEFFISLRAEVKYPDPVPKSILRQAMRGRLPDRVLDRQDKTAFDDYVLDIAEYEVISKWAFGSDYRVAGVDYDLLRERLESRTMGTRELSWAQDLAKAHAFVERFG